MALKAQNVLVFGATGMIGRYIFDALLNEKQHFSRIALFTSPATAVNKTDELNKLKQRGAEVIVGDVFKISDVENAYKGFDTVISALGRTLITQQIALLDAAARSQSVRWFFPSEFGTDVAYSPQSAHERPHQHKLAVRAHIDKFVHPPEGQRAADLSYTYVVTGPFADMFIARTSPGGEERAGFFDPVGRRAQLAGDWQGSISLTTMKDVGKLTVAALLHPSASRNRALRVNSYTTTPAAILAEFERQTGGGGAWNVGYTPLDELRAVEKEAWAAGKPYATPVTLRRIWAEGGTLYERRDNADVGEPEMETLADSVHEAVQASGVSKL